MDLHTAIVGLIIIGICVIPFVMISYYKVKKERNMVKSLSNIAKQQNCTIHTYEICGEHVLGIDETNNFVFFFHQREEIEINQFINLSEVDYCEVVKKIRSGSNEASNLSFIERLDLVFTFSNKKRDPIKLELFNEEINIQIRQELLFAENWANYINDRLENDK